MKPEPWKEDFFLDNGFSLIWEPKGRWAGRTQKKTKMNSRMLLSAAN
jgi:hypothetical protein